MLLAELHTGERTGDLRDARSMFSRAINEVWHAPKLDTAHCSLQFGAAEVHRWILRQRCAAPHGARGSCASTAASYRARSSVTTTPPSPVQTSLANCVEKAEPQPNDPTDLPRYVTPAAGTCAVNDLEPVLACGRAKIVHRTRCPPHMDGSTGNCLRCDRALHRVDIDRERAVDVDDDRYRAPTRSTAFGTDAQAKAGTTTSSPGRTPAATSAQKSADVPEFDGERVTHSDVSGPLSLVLGDLVRLPEAEQRKRS